MKKNTTKLTTKQVKNLLLVLLLFLGNKMLYAQSCTVNAGGNATICGTSYTLQGSASGTTVGNPTWTLVSKPAGAPNPVISNINSYTPNVTGMTFPGNYVFQMAQNCSSGSGTSQVTITAPGDVSTFTAGPDITGIPATTGVATLNATIPAGYTASWTYYHIYSYEFNGNVNTNNATMSNTTTATPTLTLTNKANHTVDPAYRAVLRITSIYNSSCWYEDDAIVRFIPNPNMIFPSIYNDCVSNGTTGASFFYDSSSASPAFSTSTVNSAGNPSFGTTVTMTVVSQPSGGNIQYSRMVNGRLYFSGITATGSYVFDLTITNSTGSYTQRLTYNFNGFTPNRVSFVDAAYPNQKEPYTSSGSAGAVYCNMVNSTNPITFYFKIDPADPPTTITTITTSGVVPAGGPPSSIVLNGAGTMNRSVTLSAPAGGWRAGTYDMYMSVGTVAGCSRRQDFYVHVSDGARPAVNVDNITVCYPGSGVVSATIPLPAVYQTTAANPSYFQDFIGKYDFTLVSAPSGAAAPVYQAATLRSLRNTSTIISNLNKEGEYVFKIKANTGSSGPQGILDAEYACSGTSLEDTFSIFVSSQDNANAGSDQSITCSTSATLNGNDPGAQGSTGQWTLTSKPSGAPDPVITAPTQYNSGVTNLTYSGTYTFTWTITTGTCVSSDQVDINVTAAPSSVTATPATQTVAYNAVPTNLTATATGATTYQWYRNTANSNTGGTLIPGATSANYTPPTNIAGTTYYYVVAGNGSCSTPSAAVQVIVTPCAAVPNAPNVNSAVSNNCPASAVNLNTQAFTGAVPANATLQWFTDATHNNAVATPTAVGAGTYYAFYYSASSSCYSPASNAVTVTINPCATCSSADPVSVDLNTWVSIPAAPAGTTTQWHNSATPSAATLLSSTTVMATSSPTNYWVYYYDATNNCYSPGNKLVVVSNSCCNYPTVDLTSLPQTAPPAGSTLVWYTTDNRVNGTLVSNPSAVSDGVYFPFFYDSVNNNYSPVGTPVLVGINACKTGYIYITKKALDENSSVDFNFTVNGGSVTAFTLNDKETTTRINDLGFSATGRLWAVAANNTLYYRNQGSSDWVQTSVTTAVKVDGASDNNCYFTNTSGQVLQYDGTAAPTVIGSPADFGSSNAVDVGSAWNTTPYIITANQTVWIYSGSGTTWTQVGTTSNNIKGIDADPSTGDAIVTDGTIVYRLTSAGVKTSLGTPGFVDDVAVTSVGEIFTANASAYVRKWNTGTTWYANEITSRYFASRITGGYKERVWSTNTTNASLNSIYTRVLAGTNATWLDDERLRTTNKGNSIMIKVPVGTYTVKETTTSGWQLQSMDVFDPSSDSSTTFSNQSVTLSVAEGETVNAVFTNGAIVPFAMGSDCSTVFFEDFGSGTVGSFGAPLTGQTSYHYSNGSVNPTQDGYYTVVGRTTDFAYWSTPLTFDHTSNNGTGRMMAINASYDKGIFFRRKFTNLVPGKSYKFSAWLMSLSNDVIKPNATFQVVDPATGNILNQVSSGNITTDHVWNEYSMSFVPTSTEMDLILLNNAPGGAGNDIALDDIRFEMNRPQNLAVSRNCDTASVTITSPVGAVYEYSLDNINWQSSPSFTGVSLSATSFYVRYADTPACVSSSALPSCYCYKPGVTAGTVLDTKVGISALGRAGATTADNWPMTRKGGHIALEAKTKAFVPNRVAFNASGNPVGIAVANFVEGMMVYDTTNKCLKMYTSKDNGVSFGWYCITTQTCPD